jgi:peroxiredoxin
MSIPGAYGCTAESCAFRDHAAELERLGATVVGISAQDPEEQREFAAREGIFYPLLNDGGFELERRLRLPTFEAGGRRFYVRLTLAAVGGRIERVFHPVADVERHPQEVAGWLSGRARPGPADAG